MKFITFETKNNEQRLGLVQDDEIVIDLITLEPNNKSFTSMLDLINAGSEALDILKKKLKSTISDRAIVNKTDIKIIAPIPRPNRNIYCVGLNYAEHNDEFSGENSSIPEAPIIFSKVPTSVIGPEQPVDSHPNITNEVDYEAELGVIIGIGGRDIPKENVYDHIFGYTVINDITARDLQRVHKQWLLGKSLDTHCPMGPYIVHKDEISDPENLNIMSKVNGELRQSSNTKHMIFDIPTIISTISKGHTLEAGDIIATGTCAGVGMGFNPPKYLKSGDVVEVEVQDVGLLRNPIS